MKQGVWRLRSVCVGVVLLGLVFYPLELDSVEAQDLRRSAPPAKRWPELTHADILGPDGIPWTGDESIYAHPDSPTFGASADGGDIGPRRPIALKVRHVEFTVSDFITLRALLDTVTPVVNAARKEEAEIAERNRRGEAESRDGFLGRRLRR
jgi:hypothetical protein